MITLEEVREAERQHLTAWGSERHLSDAYLLSEDDRADYIAWLNQDGPVDTESYNPY